MEFDRRVQIRIRKSGGDKQGFGSGYLIAPRLVLTASHVVDGMNHADPDALRVSRPGASGQEFPAAVRWRRLDEMVDAALIEICDGHDWQAPESLSDRLTQPPQRYGLLIGTQPHPVALTGFPRMQKDLDDGRRLDEQLTGRITPGTGSLAGRYEISSTDPTLPAGLPAGMPGSRWSGISGAAVLTNDGFGGDMLCGVVRRDRQAEGGTRLTASATAHLLADPEFRNLITQHTGWEPILEPIEPAALLTSAAVDRTFRSPAALLRADAEAVAFQGRDAELSDLRDWCENKPDAFAIRVMTGPGGQGKTRLARRLVDTLGREGWATGHLRSDLTDDPPLDGTPPDFTTLATSLSLLLVIDYAETRPRLLRRLITHLHRCRNRVRLLLLARSDGEWRTGSFQAVPSVRDLFEEAQVVPLGPLVPTSKIAQDRHNAFQRAVGDLARLLPKVPTLPDHDWQSLATVLRPPNDLDHPRYDNVLTLQMTALVTLLQHGPRPADAPPGAPPERTLLQHEERFWEASARTPAYKLDLPAPTLRGAVATAVLCGANTRDEAMGVITALPGLADHQQACAAAWLASLYPGGPDLYWGPLQPDRVAEYHASQAVEEHSIALPSLLAASSPNQQAQAVTVLTRAVIAHYNAERTTDSARVLHIVDTVLDTTPLAYEALQTATAALPYPSRLITPLALRLTGTLARTNQQLLQNNLLDHEPELARSLSNFGIWLCEAGHRDQALTTTTKAAELYRRLAADNPATHEPDLARSLVNLSQILADAGRHDQALATVEEAVELHRRLAAGNPAAHEPGLAASLFNLGLRLTEAGRIREALNAVEEAVRLYRRLAAEDAVGHEPQLASSLVNLGNGLAEAGRLDEALPTTEEAVGIWRRLAADNPAAHEPGLAASLSDFGVRLLEAGRPTEAYLTTEIAVALYRQLTAHSPTRHEPGLAHSLVNLGNGLAEAGRLDEALPTTEEAVGIWRQLAADDPAANEPKLAISLSNLGNRLSEAGRHAEALTAEQEAVEISRRLAAGNSAAHEPGLAASLSNLGARLAEAGRLDEALPTTEEAVGIWRQLAADNPAAHEPGLAASLSNLGARLLEAGRPTEAYLTTEIAVALYRRLAAHSPTHHEPDLARSLANLGAQLAETGRPTEALPKVKEAVELYRRLAADNPAAHEPGLAHSLSILAMLLSTGPDKVEALHATGEAVNLYRSHVATMPSVFPQLHTILSLQANLLETLGRNDEARQVRRWLEGALGPDMTGPPRAAP
ncbi:tetratricopeptide repeat protein [Streptomyces sp. f51]|uniref:tetratricopeptide repeat protein n=1 Tax=Streptomyces sp. f51 TaxID=1827742 RepID=UPI0030D0BBFB